MTPTTADESSTVAFDSRALLRTMTSLPGVYRMLGKDGEILYVGKARNLKNRLSSYFRGSGLSPKTRALVAQIRDIQISVTQSEAEALLLESNLIKAHRPRYNILLRDDKSYPWIYLSLGQSYPRLAYHRGSRRREGRYFGPYPSAVAVRDTLNLLEKVFRLRTCEDSVFANRSRPCLQHQIQRCTAPCVGLIDEGSYAADVADAVRFLEGRSDELIESLVMRMQKAAERLDFEEAARLRDQIAQLRAISERQYVTEEGQRSFDIIAGRLSGGIACITVTTVRDGHSLGSRSHFPSLPDAYELPEILAAFIGQYYLDRDCPPELLCSVLPEEAGWLEQALAARQGRAVSLRVPQRGERVRWLAAALQNADIALGARLASRSGTAQRFADLGQALGLELPPARIECFDISHSQGEATVASCVVFGPEGAEKGQYRRYNIQGITAGDDYAAMRQALLRRFGRAVREQGPLPDVLLIDGGAGQVGVAREILGEMGLDALRIIGVAKGPERRSGLETLFLTDSTRRDEREIELAEHAPARHLIQQVRDEAHRFAITGHRARRDKARVDSELNRIPGVGVARRQTLLTHFGGLQGLRRARAEEIAKLPGISEALAQRIFEHFHEN